MQLRTTARWPATAGQRFSSAENAAAGNESDRRIVSAEAPKLARSAVTFGSVSARTSRVYGTDVPVDVCEGVAVLDDDLLDPGEDVADAEAACD